VYLNQTGLYIYTIISKQGARLEHNDLLYSNTPLRPNTVATLKLTEVLVRAFTLPFSTSSKIIKIVVTSAVKMEADVAMHGFILFLPGL
jgi:hypothetical protein